MIFQIFLMSTLIEDRWILSFLIFFTIDIQYYFMLLEGVQHSGQKIMQFSKSSLQYVKQPSGTIHTYYIIIDYILSVVLDTHPCDYCVTTNLSFLIPSPSSPSPPRPPLITISLFYESVQFFPIYFDLQIPHMSEIIWYLSFSD